MKKRNLYIELFDQKNRYLDDKGSFDLVRIYTKLLYSILISSLFLGGFLLVLSLFFISTNKLSLIDFTSLIVGYSCLFSAFRMIKEKIIPYLFNNPIFISAIFFTSFFNASFIQLIFDLTSFNFDFRLIILVISIILNYLLLSTSYNKYYNS